MKNNKINTTTPSTHEPHELSNENQIRLQKIAALHEKGISPWPNITETITLSCDEALDEFDEKHTEPQTLAGRLMLVREHGKTLFGKIQDQTGELQIYLRQDILGQEPFAFFQQMIDIGDIIWIKGTLFKTKTDEITLKVDAYQLLSKCLHPLPEKFHGLTDIEKIYRQRYLDLITNKDSRERFIVRSHIIRLFRMMLDEFGCIEVETPMLQPIPGGAAARPFVTHHNALDADLYLRIAPELYLKRLVVGGFDRVYEINRNFRNEGISTRHNPEFTMLEFYFAYLDYHFMMDFVENMVRLIVEALNDEKTVVSFAGKQLNFGTPFARLTMYDAVMKYGALNQEQLTHEAIDTTLLAKGITLEDKQAAWGHKLYALFEAVVEPQLFQPTFITHFPIEVSPLAKRDEKDPKIAARFELFIGGMELSNGFNELNDPFDQKARFEEQARAHASGVIDAHRYDADYIQTLEYGLPPTVGCGIGIDRLAMLLTNTTSIKDVILFPTLKQK